MKSKLFFKFNQFLREFVNDEILQDLEDPKDPHHYDYRYLKSKSGPLYQGAYPQELPKKQVFVLKQTSIERKAYGGVRMCQRCLRTKPDRCHHCSQCNSCVLKMDHHCPWVANCIGFYNYKFFLCMLFYTAVTCHIIVWSSL